MSGSNLCGMYIWWCVFYDRIGADFKAAGHSQIIYTGILLTDFKQGLCRAHFTTFAIRGPLAKDELRSRKMYWEFCFMYDFINNSKMVWWMHAWQITLSWKLPPTNKICAQTKLCMNAMQKATLWDPAKRKRPAVTLSSLYVIQVTLCV